MPRPHRSRSAGHDAALPASPRGTCVCRRCPARSRRSALPYRPDAHRLPRSDERVPTRTRPRWPRGRPPSHDRCRSSGREHRHRRHRIENLAQQIEQSDGARTCPPAPMPCATTRSTRRHSGKRFFPRAHLPRREGSVVVNDTTIPGSGPREELDDSGDTCSLPDELAWRLCRDATHDEVDSERASGERAGPLEQRGKCSGSSRRVPSEHAEGAGLRDGRGQLGWSRSIHAGLLNRHCAPDELGERVVSIGAPSRFGAFASRLMGFLGGRLRRVRQGGLGREPCGRRGGRRCLGRDCRRPR